MGWAGDFNSFRELRAKKSSPVCTRSRDFRCDATKHPPRRQLLLPHRPAQRVLGGAGPPGSSRCDVGVETKVIEYALFKIARLKKKKKV